LFDKANVTWKPNSILSCNAEIQLETACDSANFLFFIFWIQTGPLFSDDIVENVIRLCQSSLLAAKGMLWKWQVVGSEFLFLGFRASIFAGTFQKLYPITSPDRFVTILSEKRRATRNE